MKTSSKGSVHLMLALFVAGLSVILFSNSGGVFSAPFITNALCVIAACVISAAYFMPSAYILSKTGAGLFDTLHKLPASARYFSSVFYSMYFVWLVSYLLVSYGNLFADSVNPSANGIFVIFAVLAACVYSACTAGEGAVRGAVFAAAFAAVSFAVFFAGNISKLDFTLTFGASGAATVYDVFYGFLRLGFTAVIFGAMSGKSDRSGVKSIFFTLGILALIGVLSVFFSSFALGSYASSGNSLYLLSKSALSVMSVGADCLFLVLITAVIFTSVTASLIGASRAVRQNGCGKVTVMFGIICFVLCLCACLSDCIENILLSPALFNIFTFAAAVAVPVIYIFALRRKRNV